VDGIAHEALEGQFDEEVITLSQVKAVVSVIPAYGRVMHFGRNHRNTMWVRDASADEGWKNWGGDKSWWWPQREWWSVRGGEVGKGWPPPAVIDGEPWEVLALDDRSLTMRSVVDPALGAYTRRSFELIEGESAMRTTTTLVPEPGVGLASQEGRLPEPYVPWVITQVATDGPIYARLVDGAAAGDVWVKGMSGEAQTRLSLRDDGWVEIDRQADGTGYKVGLEADVLAIELADGSWYVQRYAGSDTGGGFPPAERAQVYQDGRYVELEFIGPSDGGAGERSMVIDWSIEDAPPWAGEGE
jgi:hypothetical protein